VTGALVCADVLKTVIPVAWESSFRGVYCVTSLQEWARVVALPHVVLELWLH